MPAVKDLIDKIFGKFVAKENVPAPNGIVFKCAYWRCECTECGRTDLIMPSHGLQSGTANACKCDYRFHGKSKTKVHSAWQKLRRRCKTHPTYLARGIIYDPSFEDFNAFYSEVGDPPEDNGTWTLDRINNDLGYIPGNLRWATWTEQSNNRSCSLIKGLDDKICVDGVCKSPLEWKEENNLTSQRISIRIKRGWSKSDAFTQPLGTVLRPTSSPEISANKSKAKAQAWVLTKPDGSEIEVKNLKAFCLENQLNSSCMVGLAKGRGNTHKKWKCRKAA